MTPRVLLVDAYSQIYRAYFAIRHLTTSDGRPVNAVFGFANILQKSLAALDPSHVAAVFDCGPPQRRLAIQADYKAQRPPTPPDLEPQLPILRELLAAWRIPIVAVEGEEADDLIATLACHARQDNLPAIILSNDKDFAQIVTPQIRWLHSGSTTPDGDGPAEILNRFGVHPHQMTDYLSLIGDKVDNIPGVAGIGPKTAAALLAQFGSLDNLLRQLRQLDKPRLRQALENACDQLRQNQQMIRLRQDLTLPIALRDLTRQPPDPQRLQPILDQLGFRTLRRELLPSTTDPQTLLDFGAT